MQSAEVSTADQSVQITSGKQVLGPVVPTSSGEFAIFDELSRASGAANCIRTLMLKPPSGCL